MMEQLYITSEKAKELKRDKSLVKSLEHLCSCKITIEGDDLIQIDGDAYGEFSAKGILFAYGRGFNMDTARKLVGDEYYFSSIDIGQVFGNEKRVHQMKARIIGEGGRTKTYIEEVSGAKLSVYGDTVSFIGSITQINEAETAVNTLLEGGTHKLAYARMEEAHRKNKRQQHDAHF